uniref:YTH domain-containing protein n=1 Tax=Panagrellus redivivus TaxID=6233 RepID=A0A7E4WBV2_PANRE
MDIYQNLTLVDDWGIPPSASSSVQSIASSNESEAASVFSNMSNTSLTEESKPFFASNNGMPTVPNMGSMYNNFNANAQYPGGPYQGLMGWSTMPNSLYQALDYGWQLPFSASSSMPSAVSSIQSERSAFKPVSSHARVPAVPQYSTFDADNNAPYPNGPNPTPSASSSAESVLSSANERRISTIASDDILRNDSPSVSSHSIEAPTGLSIAQMNPAFIGNDIKPYPNGFKQEPSSNHLQHQYGLQGFRSTDRKPKEF